MSDSFHRKQRRAVLVPPHQAPGVLRVILVPAMVNGIKLPPEMTSFA